MMYALKSVSYSILCVFNLPPLPIQQMYETAAHMTRVIGTIVLALVVVTLLMLIRQLLISSGDVEVNPGPLGKHDKGKVTFVTACALELVRQCIITRLSNNRNRLPFFLIIV